LAYFELIQGHRSKNKSLNLILPFIGLILIGHSIIFFNDKMHHPSFYTLSPIIGVCLVIWFSNQNDLITKILSTKLFVGIGLISYSLYLWHYPIFAFARITEFTSGSITKKILLLAIIFTLSILSYFLIEKPFRNRKFQFKNVLLLIVSLSIFLIITNSLIIYKDGIKERLPDIFQKVTMEETHKLIKNSFDEECLGLDEGCIFNKLSDKKVYLIGDSHAASLGLNLKSQITNKNFQFKTYLFGGCGFFPGFNLVERNNMKIDKNCNNKYFNRLIEILKNETDSIIIFSARMPAYLNDNEFSAKNGNDGKKRTQFYKSNNVYENLQSSFKTNISKIAEKNKIILIYPVPEFEVNVPRKLFNKYLKEGFVFNKDLEHEKFLTIPVESYDKWSESTFKLFDSLINNNFYRVYPHKLFCNALIENKCISHDYKDIFYFDSQHLSSQGAKLVNDLVLKEINNINF
jgi:hypothetical protein